jgi:hypothetical protein
MTPEKILRSLNTPKKIQDFLNTLGARKENTHIVRSPHRAMRDGNANCMEGALIAAAALRFSGARPLLLDLKVGKKNTKDVDHVVALFKQNGHWGAISKTSHAVLRYREPIYKTIRELVLSYFHEYFTDDGKKTLRSFSKPFDIEKEFGTEWITDENDLYELASALDDHPHIEILTPHMARGLRLADPIEIKAGKIKESF